MRPGERRSRKRKRPMPGSGQRLIAVTDSSAASQGQTLGKLSSGDQITTRVPKTDGLLWILLWILRTNRCSLNVVYSDFRGPSV